MTRADPARNRGEAIDRVRRHLARHGFPRLQIALIVALTGGFGLLSSFCLLHAGLGSMALRYPLALGLAYLFFLFLVWLWLRTQASDWLEIADWPQAAPGHGAPAVQSGGGGDFAGGGATGRFDAPAGAAQDATATNPLSPPARAGPATLAGQHLAAHLGADSGHGGVPGRGGRGAGHGRARRARPTTAAQQNAGASRRRTCPSGLFSPQGHPA